PAARARARAHRRPDRRPQPAARQLLPLAVRRELRRHLPRRPAPLRPAGRRVLDPLRADAGDHQEPDRGPALPLDARAGLTPPLPSGERAGPARRREGPPGPWRGTGPPPPRGRTAGARGTPPTLPRASPRPRTLR